MGKDVGLVRNSTYMFIGVVAAAGFTYLFNVIMVRSLGAANYAPIGVIFSATLLVAGVLKSGMSYTVAKFIAEFEAKSDVAGLSAALQQGTRFALLVLGLLCLLTLIFAPVLVEQLFDGNYWLYVALIAALIFQVPWSLFNGVFQGFRQIGTVSLLQATGALAQLCVAILGLMLLRQGFWAGVWGIVIGPMVVLIVGVWRLRPIVRQLGLLGEGNNKVSLAQLAVFSLPVTFVNGAIPFLLNLSPLLLKTISQVEREVGSFVATLVIVQGPLFLSRSFFIALFPYLVREGLIGENVNYFRRSLALLLGGSGLFVSGAVWVGPALLKLIYGPTLLVSRRDMLLLSLTTAFLLLARLLSQSMIARSQLKEASFAWGVGLSTFGAGLLILQLAPLTRIEVALVASSFATLTALTIAMMWRLNFFQRTSLEIPTQLE